MNEEENFMTSARYLIYIGLVLLALFVVDEQHKMEVFVFAGAVGFYLESRKDGWQSPLIEWLEELSFLATCYYASLKFIKFGIILEAVVLIYLCHNGLMQSPYLFHILGTIYIVSLIWLTAVATVYFILMLPLQLWMYFHYKGLLPKESTSIEP